MSGILGIWQRDGAPLDPQGSDWSSQAQPHRGISTVWKDAQLHLGQQSLPLANQRPFHQPPLILVMDARLDNRSELQPALGLPDSASDADLIALAYRRWGERCPEHLLGDFAFALWDADQHRLFCARDPLGVKPFYYLVDPQRFAFASEIQPLLNLPAVSREFNEVVLAEYLLMLRGLPADPAQTFYQQVQRLPAGHSLTITPDTLRVQRYWALDPDAELDLPSDEAYAETLRDYLTDAVRVRLRSPFPVAASLSGGLDSSTIVCLARQIGAPLHSFYLLPAVESADERAYVRDVLAGGALQHHEQAMPSALHNIDALLVGDGAPPFGPNPALAAALYQAAAENGARVFLDGIDGDSIIGHGWGVLSELADRHDWQQFMREADALRQYYPETRANYLRRFGRPLSTALRQGQGRQWLSAARALHGGWGVPPSHLIWRYSLAPLIFKPISTLRRNQRALWPQANPMLQPEFAQRLRLDQRLQEFRSESSATTTARQRHYRDLMTGNLQRMLEEQDLLSARAGIEVRHPFCDRRVVELCLALPSNQHLRNGWSRYILRQAMQGILPDSIRWRGGKTDFSPHVWQGYQTVDQPRLEALFHGSRDDAYIRVSALRSAYESLQTTDNLRQRAALTTGVKWLLWRQANARS